MSEFRLLERIRSFDQFSIRYAKEDHGKKIVSIAKYLNKIFNTRQGGVAIDTRMGLPDFNSLLCNLPESIDEIALAIEENIYMYEPRLKTVKVTHYKQSDNFDQLHFHIYAELLIDHNGAPVFFESTIGSNGKIEVKK